MPNKKHIVVLGAGIIGTTTAYYLAEHGYDVTVVECRNGVAQETSFANGAQLCYSCIQPLDNPELTAIRNDLFQNAAIEFNLLQQKIHDDFSYNPGGVLQLFFDSQAFEDTKDLANYKRQHGIDLTILSAAECINQQYSLQNSSNIHGGIFMHNDGIGDAFAFTKIIATSCQRLGVRFLFDKEINKIDILNDSFNANAYVVCLGAHSKEFLDPLDISLDIKYIKGYSISIKLDSNDEVPEIGIADPVNDIFYARLGDYLRVAGIKEEENNTELNERQTAVLMNAANNLFPLLKVFDKERKGQITKWACVRPSSVTKIPFISSTKYSNVFLNTGHGGYGWTLAAVSAKRIMEVIRNAI